MRRACVIGHPVAHSRSPIIHRHWLAQYRIDGDYVREDIAPDRFDGFVRTLASHGYVGANVTVPHKEAAFRGLERADARAAMLKAANTIWLENGQLVGTNTDVYGFLANLDERAPGWERACDSAVVIGAGGAARAVVHALKERGVAGIVVVNRTAARAQSLAGEMRVAASAFDELPRHLAAATLLVNATTLGMKGEPPLGIDLSPLPANAIVCDIVYVPLETPLLAAARARGLRVVDGLGMLLHQAAPGFERWFGVRPEVSAELRAKVLADLTEDR